MSREGIEALRVRTAPLDMSTDAFRTAGHDLVDRIADWLDRAVLAGEGGGAPATTARP